MAIELSATQLTKSAKVVANKEQMAVEKQVEKERKAAEKLSEKLANKERKAAEKQAEKERKAAEKQAEKLADKERKAAEKQAEKERKASEKQAGKLADKERKAADKQLAITKSPLEVESEVDTELVTQFKGFCHEVLGDLGAGHLERIYHNALQICLQDANLRYETERELPVMFRDRQVGVVRADIIIARQLVIELKQGTANDSSLITATEQCRQYMKLTGIGEGLVVIFPKQEEGKKAVDGKIGFKRVFL